MLVLLGNVFYARMSLMFLLVVIAPIVAMAVTSAIYFLLDLLGCFGGHLFGRETGMYADKTERGRLPNSGSRPFAFMA